MPDNAASRSIHLPSEIAGGHSVQFHVFSRLAVSDVAELNKYLSDPPRYMKSLNARDSSNLRAVLHTRDGENTGNGFYVLKVDSIEEARRIRGEDSFHKSGVRSPTVEPWLQVMD